MNQQTFTFDKSERDVQDVRQASRAIAIEDSVANAGLNQLFETIAQSLCMFVALENLLLRQLGGNSERDDVGNRFSPRAALTLLMSTDLLRRQTNSSPNVQCSNSFGRIDLVCRQREHIAANRVNIEGNSVGRLHSIGVKPQMTMSAVARLADER